MNASRFKRWIPMGLAALALLLFHQAALAVPALTFLEFDPALLRSSGIFGWEFTANSDISITHLGFFDFEGDGLAVAHDVGMYTTGGVLIGSATVGTGNGAALVNGFRYVEVSPLMLAAGQNYVVAALNDPRDLSAGRVTGISTDPSITYAGNRTLDGPTNFTTSSPSTAYFGPNFQLGAPIPEPSTILLLGAGLVGMARWRRGARRRADK